MSERVTGEHRDKLINEAVKVAVENQETLVAKFIEAHPEVDIKDIVLIQECEGFRYLFYVTTKQLIGELSEQSKN